MTRDMTRCAGHCTATPRPAPTPQATETRRQPIRSSMAEVCRGGCGKRVIHPRKYCAPCKCASDAVLMEVRDAARIPSAVRRAVFERDGPTCRHCRRPVRLTVGNRRKNGDRLSFDHFPVPASKGGLGTIDNVVVACMDCNRRRGNRS